MSKGNESLMDACGEASVESESAWQHRQLFTEGRVGVDVAGVRDDTQHASRASYGLVDLSTGEVRQPTASVSAMVNFVEPPVFVRTFGYFDIFVKGKPVVFRSPKEKELVALLVDRNGGTVTAEEAITCLWENEMVTERTLGRYRKLCQRTKKTLEHHGLAGLIEERRGVRSLNRSMVTCDYYEMMAGSERYARMFGGRYLSNYSWAETTLGMIMQMTLPYIARNREMVEF